MNVPLLIWTVLAAFALTASLARLVQLRPVVANTSLVAARRWAFFAAIPWTLWLAGQFVVQVWQDRGWDGLLDHLAYVAAVLSLCPAMQVLGARRPTNRAWTGFVILPMIVVLCWPVITLALHGGWQRRLELETPHLVAYLLVLVMSYGNYLGGRLTFPALLTFAGLAFIGTVSAQTKHDVEHGRVEVALGLIVLSLGTLGGIRRLRRAVWSEDRFNRVWQEFSTLYGLVWSRRVLDRVNAIAVKQQWPGRLHADGFHWERALEDGTRAEVEHALRWLLRRFVDPAWLDARLGSTDKMESSPLAIDT